MYCIWEGDIGKELQRLDRAWTSPESFAFLPDKSFSRLAWLKPSLEKVPKPFHQYHFGLLTSGTTGQPVLVIGSRRRAEQLVQVLDELQESAPVREAIVALPLTYTYAFINQWLWARFLRRRLVVTPGFGEPNKLKQALISAEDAMICFVGVQVPLLERYFSGMEFPGVIRVHFAGGRFPQEALGRIRQFFPAAKIFNNYGCAQAMPRLTLRKADDSDQANDIGIPLPEIQLRSNESGELEFRSAYGAVAMIDSTGFSRIEPDTWVKTGDLGEPTQHGSWQLKGRTNEVFKRHGEKVSLAQLLSTIHRSWEAQAVFYREADPAGEDGHVLVLAPSPEDHQIREVLKAFRTHYSRAHWPLRLESVNVLPVLPNGKVDLHAVRSMDKVIHWYQRI